MLLSEELKKIAKNLEAAKADEGDSEAKYESVDEKASQALKRYKPLLMRMLGAKEGETKVDSFNKLKYLIDNKRLRKPDRFWFTALDKGMGAGFVGDTAHWVKQLNFIFTNKLPVARVLKLILDYGVEEGYAALKRVLDNNKARIIFMGEEAISKRIGHEDK